MLLPSSLPGVGGEELAEEGDVGREEEEVACPEGDLLLLLM